MEARGQLLNSQSQLTEVQEELTDSEAQLQAARAQGRQMEDELLKLTHSMEALRVDLPKQSIEDYKKSSGFEMGLV
ncbi:hypothetical protein GW17_00051788 [Ensete ventricosum]|nr:hypothetical protein GW17_00051788 [Ensete ventricosum]